MSTKSQKPMEPITLDAISGKPDRAHRRWKKRQAEKERKRLDRERLAEIEAKIHDWSESG